MAKQLTTSDVLDLFRTFFGLEGHTVVDREDSLETDHPCAFSSYKMEVIENAGGIEVRVGILECMEPGFEHTFQQLSTQSCSRLQVVEESGQLAWWDFYSPEQFHSMSDVTRVMALLTTEVSIVDGYLRTYLETSYLPDQVFLCGITHNGAFGAA